MVKLLLANGAGINALCNKGDTPLHYAAWEGYTEIINVLLAAGAKIDIQDNDGKTPLHWAISKGHSEVIVILSATRVNEVEETPL